MANQSICKIQGCVNLHYAKGVCRAHYLRMKRHGSYEARGLPNGTLLKWILENKAHDGEECLAWPFSRNPSGYGYVRLDGKLIPASRAMCQIVNGPPPQAKMQAAHSCGNGHNGCVNPKHLRWETPKGNSADRAGHGTLTRGERHPSSKLTQAQMIEIRDAVGTSREIAERYSTSPSTVRRIKQKRHWVWRI